MDTFPSANSALGTLNEEGLLKRMKRGTIWDRVRKQKNSAELAGANCRLRMVNTAEIAVISILINTKAAFLNEHFHFDQNSMRLENSPSGKTHVEEKTKEIRGLLKL